MELPPVSTKDSEKCTMYHLHIQPPAKVKHAEISPGAGVVSQLHGTHPAVLAHERVPGHRAKPVPSIRMRGLYFDRLLESCLRQTVRRKAKSLYVQKVGYESRERVFILHPCIVQSESTSTTFARARSGEGQRAMSLL